MVYGYMLCKHCKKISHFAFNFFTNNIIIGIGLVIVGIRALLHPDPQPPINHAIIFFSLGFGLFNIINFFIQRQTCPECKSSNTLLPLESPEAQEIIKENDIKFP